MEEASQAWELLGAVLEGLDRWEWGRARAVPPPEPHPQEEHPEPYQGEELEVVPKPLRSPIVPCR